MNLTNKAIIAVEACNALMEALDANLEGRSRQERKAVIKRAERELIRLKAVCDPDKPFRWSLHHDSPDIDVAKEIRATVEAGTESMEENTAKYVTQSIIQRYLDKFGAMIGVEDIYGMVSDKSKRGTIYGR